MSSSTVVTGIGVTAPNGMGTRDYWQATCAGTTGISRIERFDASGYPLQLAGEVPNYDASEHLPSRLLPQTDRMTRLALTATDWALADAGIGADTFDDLDMGVVTAASSGGFEFGQNELKKLWSQGNQHVSAYQSFAWFYAVNSGQISIRHNMRGPSGVVVSDQSGGLDAVAHARRQIRKGTKAVVTGGIDATICPWGWVALLASDRLSTDDDPARAYVPFDARARGHVPGEGGAILVTEDGDGARERGAHIYGEIAGYGATFDGSKQTGDSEGLIRAIETALADAHVHTDDIDVVFADAAAQPDLDRSEADALTHLFGERGVPVTAPKTMTGRLYSGGGALDIATALLSISEGVIPPTINTELDSDLGLDLVSGSPRSQIVRHALVLARGHHGFNSAIVARAA